MSGKYPIWNEVEACIYKSSKSWGAKNTSTVTTFVGSGSTYSEKFFKQIVTKRRMGDYLVFKLSIDDKIIKTKYFNIKTKKFTNRKPIDLK